MDYNEIMPKPLQFTFRLKVLEHGWAEGSLFDEDTNVIMRASYVFDGLGDLVRTVKDLYLSTDWERTCSWLEEPGELRWVFLRTGDSVNVKVVAFPNWSPGLANDRGEVVFETTASLRRVATQVRGQMKRVLNEFGEDGYRERWRHAFPTEALLELGRLIDAGMKERQPGRFP